MKEKKPFRFGKTAKRVTATALSATMLMGSVITYAQAGTQDAIVYENGNYVAKKLSHPTKGASEVDGIVDYLGNGEVGVDVNGEGDRGQSYSWASVAYGDWVYIGTCYGALTTTVNIASTGLGYIFDKEIMTAALNALFNGSFYTGQEDGADSKGVVVKINAKTGETKLVMSLSSTGKVASFRNAVEYKGKLYFCGSVNNLPCIYEIDPETDEFKQVYSGVSASDMAAAYQQKLSVGIRGITIYKDKLVASCMGLNGAFIIASDHPTDGEDAFTVIADMDDLYNYPAYHYSDSIYGGSIWDMIEYNDKLYVSICTGTPDNMPDENTMQSFAIVVGEENADGIYSWRPLAGNKEKDGARYTFGIDPERTRSGAANLIVYNDYLYIGEYNDEEIALFDIIFEKNCDFMNANLEQSVNLYRMDKEENMELVVGDADKMFPNGSLSGFGSGFDRNENQYIWKMCIYDGKLYVGTMDTSSLLEPFGQFVNGDILNMSAEELESQIQYLKIFVELLQNKNSNKAKTLEASPEKTDALTDEQIENLEKVADSVNEKVINNAENYKSELEEISSLIEQLKQYIEEEVTNKIEELYDEIVARIQEIVKQIEQEINEIKQDIDNIKVFIETIKSLKEEIEINYKTISSFLETLSYLTTAERGFDLYVTDDGVNFETITTNGFNNPYNHGLRTTAITDYGVAFGTANPFYGTQVWLLSEKNADDPAPEESSNPESSEPESSSPESSEPESSEPESSSPESSKSESDSSTSSMENSKEYGDESSNENNNNSSEQGKSGTVNTGDYTHIAMITLFILAAALSVILIKAKFKKIK